MAWFRSSGPSVSGFLLKSARKRAITSEARLPSRFVWRGFARAINIRRLGVQHLKAHAGVGDDARQRRINLMRSRRRKLGYARDAIGICGRRDRAGPMDSRVGTRLDRHLTVATSSENTPQAGS
jgi:hypothetical protein